jgi:exo-beta-1,3-glucanase (GH17 family)
MLPVLALTCVAVGASCLCEDIPACSDGGAPEIHIQVFDEVFPPPNPEFPYLVVGSACPGSSIENEEWESEYEIILYARTDQYYIQPTQADYRIAIRQGGCFRSYSHRGDCFVAFLVRRGLTWPVTATAAELPVVDAHDVITQSEFCIEGDPDVNKPESPPDSDGDGVADDDDGCPQDGQKVSPGACGCGVPDADSDHDGIPDCVDDGPGGQIQVQVAELFAHVEKRWINYAPTHFDPVTGRFPTEDPLRDDLRRLCVDEGYGGILSYSSDPVLGMIPRLAKEVGCQVVGAGIYDINNEEEVNRALAVADFVDFYIVGSEGIWADRYTLEDLRRTILLVREKGCKPVTTAEPWQTWREKLPDAERRELIALIDFLSANIYGWWLGVHDPCPAVEDVEREYRALERDADGKRVLIRETGWPTSGHPDASVCGQREYFACLEAIGLPFVYFEAFDQPWKHECCCEPDECHDIGPHWGLHDASGALKTDWPDGEPTADSLHTCPACDGVLYTIPEPCFEGQYGVTRLGLDHFKLGLADRHFPVRSCGFGYHEGHAGGSGDTLELLGCDDSVYFFWAFSQLQEVAVRQGWQGRTDQGLRIGDSVETLLRLYPKARRRGGDTETLWSAGAFKIAVDSQGVITKMGVDERRLDDDSLPPIGPVDWR